jgi:hypothetical protein
MLIAAYSIVEESKNGVVVFAFCDFTRLLVLIPTGV